MYQESFFPLRTIAGATVELAKNKKEEPDVLVVEESAAARSVGVQYEWRLKSSLTGTVHDPLYSRYLPTLEIGPQSGGSPMIIGPGPGMDSVPIPGERPFSLQDPVLSLFALGKKLKRENISRELSVTLRIRLARRALVGGVCFGGMPHLPYAITKAGESASNFGVPREVRLTCLSPTSDDRSTDASVEFIDADLSVTKQDFILHSGFHYLCTEPAWTDVILLRLSDYPSFVTRLTAADLNQLPRSVEERWGFVLPYFYVFEYQEQTRYRPIVPGGLLGMRGHSGAFYAPAGGVSSSTLIDYSFLVLSGGEKRYVSFTGGSLFGQGRTFPAVVPTDSADKPKPRDLKECFVSQMVTPNERITIYVQQAEEYARCIAGIKLLLPFVPDGAPVPPGRGPAGISDARLEHLEQLLTTALGLPSSIVFCRKIGLKVFEIDPIDGVSPILVSLDSKFATLLAEREIDTLSEIILTRVLEGVQFVRPSSSKHFAIELTNLDVRPAHFVVHDLDLIQSAHVTVHPRASRTQQVRALNFRIVGSDLSEDYSLLSPDGFSFSIERFVAGERKSVLLRANSLLDLLHTGAAKLFNNARRRAVEFEKSETYPVYKDAEPKYLVPGEYLKPGPPPRFTPSFTPNYENRFTRARLEGWRRSETGGGVDARKTWETHPGRPFKSFSNQIVRTKNELIYPDSRRFNKLRDFWEKVAEKAGKSTWIPDEDDIPELWVDSDLWRGVAKSKLKIKGLLSVSGNPVGFTKLSHVDSELDQLLDKLSKAGPLHFTGGSSSSLTGSIGILSSTLGINPYPTVAYQATYGTQGSISRQAADSGYAYSQHLNEGYDEGDGYTEVRAGEMKRVVTHRDVPDTDGQRVKGAEVMWQGRLVDIVTGSIPLNFTLPATASDRYMRTADDSLRVRFSNGVRRSISVDFWFDLTAEVVRDDY